MMKRNRCSSEAISKTKKYYEDNAAGFFDSTVGVDMTAIANRFIEYIPENARILDAGCGSGRDSAFFKNKGFLVEAFDISPELAEMASKLLGQKVRVLEFSDLDYQSEFQAVWTCASLLHLPEVELKKAFNTLWEALINGGVLYCSFKYGDYTGIRNGRYFIDLEEASLKKILLDTNGFEILEIWVTEDVRSGRDDELWLNAILKKMIAE